MEKLIFRTHEGIFRPLQGAECRTLIMRHEVHGKEGAIKNELPPSACQRASNRGRWLKEAGLIQIDSAESSPEPRAWATVMNVLIGHGKLLPIRTKEGLGSYRLFGGDTSTLKARARQLGVADFHDLFLSPNRVSHEFAAEMFKLAFRVSQYLIETARFSQGKTVILGSHGGSTIEPGILALKNQSAGTFEAFGQPKQVLDYGGIVELIICLGPGSAQLLEENYLVFP